MQPKIANKISKIESYLLIVDELKAECEDKFLKDFIYQGALLHYLYLISDGCVVLAKMLLKEKGIDYAQSYYEAIDLLGEKNIIPKEFAYSFAKIASFRNFLAHDYEKANYVVICKDILLKMSDVKQYISYIKDL